MEKKKKTKEKKSKKKKRLFHPESNSGPPMCRATLLTLCHVETYCKRDDNILFKAFPLELLPARPV